MGLPGSIGPDPMDGWMGIEMNPGARGGEPPPGNMGTGGEAARSVPGGPRGGGRVPGGGRHCRRVLLRSARDTCDTQEGPTSREVP